MKIVYDNKTGMQLAYDLDYKITLGDLQRVKSFRHYLIHGVEYRYTANGTTGYVYVQIGYNKFYVAEYQYQYGEWYVYDVMNFANNTQRIYKQVIRYR